MTKLEKQREACRKWRLAHPEYKREYYKRNRSRLLVQARVHARRYQQRNVERLIEFRKKKYAVNRLEIRATERQHRIDNLEHARERDRKHYWKNRERKLDLLRKRRAKNPEKFRLIDKQRRSHRARVKKLRYHSDIQFAIKSRLRCRLSEAIKSQGARKCGSTGELLGCSIPDFIIYLESKFQPGMTLENHGKIWHIDHIMPCAIFDLTKPEHQKRCFHFSNLRPLFALDNQIKHCKVITNQFSLL